VAVSDTVRVTQKGKDGFFCPELFLFSLDFFAVCYEESAGLFKYFGEV